MDEEILKIQTIQYEKQKAIDKVYRTPTRRIGDNSISVSLAERNTNIKRINDTSNLYMSNQYDLLNEKRIKQGKQLLKNPYKIERKMQNGN